MPKGKPHLYKEGGLIESLRAKHDPHYKLASKVAGLQDSGEQVDKLGKEIGIKFQGIHKTLGKSFASQRKTLKRVIGLEGRVKNIETGVEIWTNRQADRNKQQDTVISNLTDVIIQALGDIRSGKAGAAGSSGSVGDWDDEVSGDWDATSGSGSRDGSDGASGLDGFDGADGVGGDDGSDGAGGINGESFLGEDNYERFADELQQQGTIAGQQVSPQERKEGFKKRNNKIGFQKFVTKVLNKKGKKGKSGKSGSSGSAGGFGAAGSTGKSGASSAAADVEGVSKSVDGEEGDGEGEKEPAVKEIVTFLKSALDPSLTKIEENLDKILGHLEGKVEADKDKADDIKQGADAAADDAREAELEKKGGSKIVGPAFDKAIKPVKGFLDMILKFFMNVILGGVVMRLVDVIQNPKKLLDPFFLIINGITTVLNQIIKAIWFIGTAPTRILKNALEFGLNNMISVINMALGALKKLGVDFSIPEVDFPDIPQAPQIPMIPLSNAQDAGSAPAVAMAGGGLVQGLQGGGSPGVVTDPAEKKRIEEETLYWVNKERTEYLGLPPLDKISYADGVELTKPMGKEFYGAGIKEESTDDWNFDTMTRTTSKWKQRGSEIIFQGASETITEEQKQAYLDSNPVARMAMELKDQAELDALGADISASAKMNKGGKVPGSGNKDTVPAMLTPGEFVMSKGAVEQIGVEKLMAMNAAGGGTNKPQLMKFAGGGVVPDPPGPRRSGGVTIMSGGGRSGGGASSSSGGDQSSVSAFSARDMLNNDMLLIKSIYNIAG